jgi:hypothetical protein
MDAHPQCQCQHSYSRRAVHSRKIFTSPLSNSFSGTGTAWLCYPLELPPAYLATETD